MKKRRWTTWATWSLRAGAALLLFSAGCKRDPQRRAFDYMPEMVDSIPYDAFSPNPVTRSGLTLQAPPPHTVPRGYAPFRYGSEPEEALRAGRELTNPTPATKESLARGQRLFQTFCFECHGQQGEGDGPIIPRFPMPPSLRAEHARKMADGQIYHIISKGQKLMPAYAVQIPAADRWPVINYVRSLQQGVPNP